MKNSLRILGLATLLLVSCRTPMAVSNVQTQKNIQISTSIPDDGTAKMIIEPYKKSLESQMNAKLSYTGVELTKLGDNSNLGNLLADYTLAGAKNWAAKNNSSKIDAAVINIGGIRTSIGKGEILLKHIFEVSPFENELVIVKMPGSAMQELFDYYLKTQKNNPVSGLEIETEKGALTKMLINGKAMDTSRDYHIATSDYLALGGDNMTFFSKGEMITTGIKLRDLYIDILKNTKEVVPPTDIRLTFKDQAE